MDFLANTAQLSEEIPKVVSNSYASAIKLYPRSVKKQQSPSSFPAQLLSNCFSHYDRFFKPAHGESA